MMDVYAYLKAVHDRQPLVHHITNWVTIYDCAQAVKSLGASPVMAHAPEEAADMASLAAAVALNIGTLTDEVVEAMKLAAQAANRKGAPVVLDVCGAGATPYRDRKNIELLDETRIDIIKGNASEIARIAGRDVHTKGVDASHVADDLQKIAMELAAERACVVAVTGPIDIVADAQRAISIANGHEMMTRVVGTGCMATSLIATFVGASPGNLLEAAAAALVCYGIAGEIAAGKADGPASYKTLLLDELYRLSQLDAKSIAMRARVSG